MKIKRIENNKNHKNLMRFNKKTQKMRLIFWLAMRIIHITSHNQKEVKSMGKFIRNLNEYLTQKKIKQTFLSLKTGMEPSKLSRILTGAQDITSMDMERLAQALGKNVEYFLADDFFVADIKELSKNEVFFYAGKPTREQEEFAKEFLTMLENADEIMSAKGRLAMDVGLDN